MKKVRKWILIIAGVIVLLAALTAVIMLISFNRDPDAYLKRMAKEIKEDQTAEISFIYDYENESNSKKIPHFYFTPSEDGNYRFTVSDSETNTDIQLSMDVMDKYFDDFFMADNIDHDTGKPTDTFSEATALQKSHPCYVVFSVLPLEDNGEVEQISGSFRLTITKDTGEEGPPQLTADGQVTLEIKADGQECAVFEPPETGYYRFENSIVSKDGSSGFSTLASVTSADDEKVKITEDICMLQQGKEYYVWVTTNETDSKKSKVELSCIPLKTEEATGVCAVDINEASMIEYVADRDLDLAVYTVSKGDPGIIIYEEEEFPLRTDDGSEASLSDNPNDVAAVLRVKRGTNLHICIYGDVSNCRVYMTEYTGDGTTLTIDDVLPLPEEASKETPAETPGDTPEDTPVEAPEDITKEE